MHPIAYMVTGFHCPVLTHGHKELFPMLEGGVGQEPTVFMVEFNKGVVKVKISLKLINPGGVVESWHP